jgi:hypothetical protein
MKRLTKLAGAMVLLLAIGTLSAQPAPEPAAAPSVSAAEMVAQTEALAERVRSSLQFVQHLQTQARAEQDIIKLSCVNDKLVLLKAQSNVFDSSRTELQVVLDTSAADAAFERVAEAAAGAEKLREEAAGCAGHVELNDSITTFSSPEIIDDPTVALPFSGEGDPTLEPPGYASPFN